MIEPISTEIYKVQCTLCDYSGPPTSVMKWRNPGEDCHDECSDKIMCRKRKEEAIAELRKIKKNMIRKKQMEIKMKIDADAAVLIPLINKHRHLPKREQFEQIFPDIPYDDIGEGVHYRSGDHLHSYKNLTDGGERDFWWDPYSNVWSERLTTKYSEEYAAIPHLDPEF